VGGIQCEYVTPTLTVSVQTFAACLFHVLTQGLALTKMQATINDDCMPLCAGARTFRPEAFEKHKKVCVWRMMLARAKKLLLHLRQMYAKV
jgi:hypothetical protein